MSSSQHSALASLHAMYTDSEDEAEDMEDADASGSSQVEVIEKSPFNLGPDKKAASPGSSSGRSTGSGTGGDSGNMNARKLVGGLVSYNDDLIDDDAVDDTFMHSDSTSDTQEVDKNLETVVVSETDTPDQVNGDQNSQDSETHSVDATRNEDSNSSSISRKSKLPPEPPGKCSSELQEKMSKLYQQKVKTGLDMNEAIQRNKNFRNPSIYEKLIKYCDIDELGSNYPRTVFDPHEWHESSFYDELAKAQKELMEKREKERKEKAAKVEFVSGTIKRTATAADAEPKRKSKWDQRGAMPVIMNISAPTVSQGPTFIPTVTTAPTGNKATVISAFGSIKKKV